MAGLPLHQRIMQAAIIKEAGEQTRKQTPGRHGIIPEILRTTPLTIARTLIEVIQIQTSLTTVIIIRAPGQVEIQTPTYQVVAEVVWVGHLVAVRHLRVVRAGAEIKKLTQKIKA